MAISATTVFEVRQGGSDTNGGGFDPTTSGTDYTLQDAAQIAVTDAVANGTTTITSATAGFTTAHVGNLVYLAGGTGTLTGTWRQVISRTDASTIVVDDTVAAGTGITLNLGGAFASPSNACNVSPNNSDCTVFIKYNATAYSVPSANSILASSGVGASNYLFRIIGYDTTRTVWNMDANRPILDVADDSTTVLTMGGVNLVRNLVFTNIANKTVCTSISASNECRVDNCKSTGYDTAFMGGSAPVRFTRCEAIGFSAYGFHSSSFTDVACDDCSAHTWTNTAAIGFSFIASCRRCIAYDGFLIGFECFDFSNTENCVADNVAISGSVGDGFSFANSVSPSVIVNCIATRCARNGFYARPDLGLSGYYLINCAGYNNAGGNYSAGLVSNVNIIGDVALTGMPYSGGGSFALNNTSGAGATLKAAGWPSGLPPGMTQNLDVGAIQGSSVGSGPAGPINYAF